MACIPCGDTRLPGGNLVSAPNLRQRSTTHSSVRAHGTAASRGHPLLKADQRPERTPRRATRRSRCVCRLEGDKRSLTGPSTGVGDGFTADRRTQLGNSQSHLIPSELSSSFLRPSSSLRQPPASASLGRSLPVQASAPDQPLADPPSSSGSSASGGGSVLGAVALITGTSVGAGMLALPMETAPAGFVPSATLLCLCWAFLTLEAFLLADVNVHLMQQRAAKQDKASHQPCDEASEVISLRTMAEETLGPVGGWLSTATYVFLSYTLMVAYVAKGADVISAGNGIPADIAAASFTAVLGGLVYAGSTKTTDWLNRIMTGALLALFGVIVAGGAMEADWSELATQHWSEAPHMLPVVFLSLVFHDLIPVLCSYLDGDMRRVRTALALGGAVPLAMFLAWDAVALSLSHASSAGDPLDILMSLGGSAQAMTIESFSLLAVATSFLGTALSFGEFFMEQLGGILRPPKTPLTSSTSLPAGQSQPQDKVSIVEAGKAPFRLSKQHLRAAAFGLVLVPPLALSACIPDAFFAASEAAGAYGMTVLYGVFPPLMFWKCHQRQADTNTPSSSHSPSQSPFVSSPWQQPAGGFALASMGACAMSVIISQAMLDMSHAGSDPLSSVSISPIVTLASSTPVTNTGPPPSPLIDMQADVRAPPLTA